MNYTPQIGGYCPKCGNAFAVGTAFCPKCGANLAQSAQEQRAVQQNAKQPQYAPPAPPQYASKQQQKMPNQVAQSNQKNTPKPQPQPQQQGHQKNKSRTKTVKKTWQTSTSVILLVAVLLMLVLPFVGFYKYTYTADDLSDKDVREKVEDLNDDADEEVSMVEILTDEKYSIIGVFDSFVDTLDAISEVSSVYGDSSDYISSMTINAVFKLFSGTLTFVFALLFFILTLIYAIKSIIAVTQKRYGILVKYALGTFSRLIMTFVMFTIYATGSVSEYDGVIIRGGLSMSTTASAALLIALALLVVAMILTVSMNKEYAFSAEKRAITIKSMLAFVAFVSTALIMLSQKVQLLYSGAYSMFYSGSIDGAEDFVRYVIVWGVLVLYTILTVRISNEITRSGLEVLYFSQTTKRDYNIKKIREPNLLLTGILFVVIIFALYMFDSLESSALISETPVYISTAVIVGSYVAYRIIEEVFRSKKKSKKKKKSR